MALLDLINEPQVDQGLASQTLTQSVQGSAIDYGNVVGPVGAIVNFGTPGAGQTSCTVQIEECATTNGTFTQISGMVTTLTGTVAKQVVLRGLGTQRYVRANAITVAGTTPSLPCGVSLVSQQQSAPPSSKGGSDNYPNS